MSDTMPPRRSARLGVTASATPRFDNSPAPAKKRKNISSSSTTLSEPNTVVPVQTAKDDVTEAEKIEPARRGNRNVPLPAHFTSGFPLTTYSNKSLDAVLNREEEEAVGKILQKDIEELTHRGVQNMTVKELLAKNFKNYKLRQSLTSERATEVVSRSLCENEVPHGTLVSGPPVIPSTIKIPSSNHSWQGTAQKLTLNAALTNPGEPNFYWPTESKTHTHSDELSNPSGPRQTISAALESLATASEISGTIGNNDTEIEAELDNVISTVMDHPRKYTPQLKPFAYPGNHLPWDVFWKQVPEYTENNIECVVDNCRYVPISAIIKEGNFTVPIEKEVKFVFNGKAIELTLDEMLTANGINMYECAHYRMLQGWLQRAGIYIRVDYMDILTQLQDIETSGKKDLKPYPPIQLTSEKLPLICLYPNMYMRVLGRKIQGAVIVDTSGDKEPLPGQTFLTTIYSEALPFDLRRQVLVFYDAENSIKSICRKIGCTERSVKETIGTRLLIDRHLVAEQLKESQKSEGDSEMMRPKSKIRRTHYVDLNKLVWKYFKDCQATGQQINGKQLKDQAMRYAREMGLESFRGSEGWLDAFKRRHKIDLKAMTGYPVCYENEMYDEVDRECRDLDMESHLTHLHNNSAPSFLPHSTVNTAPDEFAASFFSSFGGFPQQSLSNPPQQIEQPATHLQNMINSMMTSSSSMDFSRANPSTSSDAHTTTTRPAETPETVQHVMRSCQIKIADKEISHAFDTLRKYILDNDQGAMSLLVQLQERIAATASNIKSCQNGSSTSSTST